MGGAPPPPLGYAPQGGKKRSFLPPEDHCQGGVRGAEATTLIRFCRESESEDANSDERSVSAGNADLPKNALRRSKRRSAVPDRATRSRARRNTGVCMERSDTHTPVPASSTRARGDGARQRLRRSERERAIAASGTTLDGSLHATCNARSLGVCGHKVGHRRY